MEQLTLSGPDLYHLMSSFFADTQKTAPSCKLKIECLGTSMSPFIRHKSMLTIAPYKDLEHPKLGDIVAVAVHRHKKIIIHRVIKTNHPIYLIKGDNTPAPDGWFNVENILGHVKTIDTKEATYTPTKLQNTVLAAASKSGILNTVLLPAARKLKRMFK